MQQANSCRENANQWLARFRRTDDAFAMIWKSKRSTLCAASYLVAGLIALPGIAVGAGADAAAKSPSAKTLDPTITGEEVAVLTQAPFVPPPIKRSHATKVIIKLEVREVVRKVADGAEYLFWTFGGEVPGSFMRIREGDLVEFHLNNYPSSKL